jgi:2-polyprenyl-3-methyl-5-hydroxy-6-metoxy-1,4-benzoquinol methylase
VHTTTDGTDPAEQTAADERAVAEEWARRAERQGLARVMRASQPARLNSGVTARTRHLVSELLRTAAAELHRPPASVLEVGCGAGRLTPTLARHARHVTALDMTPAMLDAARRACTGLAHVDFVLARAEQLPWRGRTFDVGVSVWVLMHLLDEAKLARVCASLAESCRHVLLIEYEHAHIPVGPWSRLRTLDAYVSLLGGADIVAERSLDYGGDRSFAALVRPHRAPRDTGDGAARPQGHRSTP